MRWFVLLCLVSLLTSGTLVLGCGASQEEPVVAPEPPPPPPPEPEAAPRVWDAESSYRLGWPIDIRVGLLNVGEVVLNAPEGRTFGVDLRARRVVNQAAAAAPVEEAAAEGEPAEEEAAEDEPAEGEAAEDEPAEGEAAEDEPTAEPQETYVEVECQSAEGDPTASSLIPLASQSNTYREASLDQLCSFTQPGRYLVELTVDVPEIEGGDVTGEQEPVTLEFELTMPDPPLVARTELGAETFTVGEPIEATVRITNYGEEPQRMAGSRQMQIHLGAESQGEAVPCSEPGRSRFSRPLELAQGDDTELTVNLAERCQLTLPGAYAVTARVEVPRSGRNAFNGELEAPPVELEIVAPERGAPAPDADMVLDDEPMGE